MKKPVFHSEIVYIAAIVLLSLAVAMLTTADFGISMIVAPAYLLSLKTGFLSFGQAEYVIQAGLFALFCLVMQRFRAVYLSSFLTCLIYGAVLDVWRLLPCFNPTVTPPGSPALWLRIALFISGILLTSFSVALFFKTYLYPQVYDFFVKGISARFHLRRPLFKTAFDLTCLLISAVMSRLFFGRWVGIGWGTLLMAIGNGALIGCFDRLLTRTVTVIPLCRRLAPAFNLENAAEPEKA